MLTLPLSVISITTISATDFKKNDNTISKDELEKEVPKLLLYIPTLNDMNAADLKATDIIVHRLKTDKHTVIFKSIEVNNNGVSVTVRFSLKDIKSGVETDDRIWYFDGFKGGKPFDRPTNIYPDSKPVPNETYDVSIGSSEPIYDFMSEGSHSYRIPGIIKLKNNDVLVNSDKRLKGASDHSEGAIEQVLRRSKDNGKTFGKQELIVKIKKPKTSDGLTIDGVFNETFIDRNKPELGTKLQYLFNVFPGYQGITRLLRGNPFIKVENENLWKIWLRTNPTSIDFDKKSYVLRQDKNHPGWWRLWKLNDGVTHWNITSLDQLTVTQTYVNTNYNPDDRSLTGQVFENVVEEDFNNKEKLESKATKHSIFDPSGAVSSNYVVAVNNTNVILESFDNGQSWTNLQISDASWRNTTADQSPFIGNSVGNGIQLKNQKDSKLNGRIIYTMYSYENGNHKAFYIYSDDNGHTWTKMNVDTFPSQTSESTIVETNDGVLYWLLRNPSRNTSIITKSLDGGLTWQSTDENDENKYKLVPGNFDGDVFNGLTYFNLHGQDYFVFAAPMTQRRKNGGLFITKDWKTVEHIWSFDTKGQEHFAYSYPFTVEVGQNYADILLAYEWNPKVYPGPEKIEGRQAGVAITLDKFRIIVKK